jgi:hypothetical protein
MTFALTKRNGPSPERVVSDRVPRGDRRELRHGGLQVSTANPQHFRVKEQMWHGSGDELASIRPSADVRQREVLSTPGGSGKRQRASIRSADLDG